MLDWQPVRGRRAPGRPVTRWDDAIATFMRDKGPWQKVAKDSKHWKQLEDDFARKGLEPPAV